MEKLLGFEESCCKIEFSFITTEFQEVEFQEVQEVIQRIGEGRVGFTRKQ